MRDIETIDGELRLVAALRPLRYTNTAWLDLGRPAVTAPCLANVQAINGSTNTAHGATDFRAIARTDFPAEGHPE